jgi:hypothetical protein
MGEIIADNLSKAGWSWGCVATVDPNRRTIFVADAHRDDGKRFAVRADEILTAFLELESAIRQTVDSRLAKERGPTNHAFQAGAKVSASELPVV